MFLQDQIKQAGFLFNKRAEKQVKKALIASTDIQDCDVKIAQLPRQPARSGVVISHDVEELGWEVCLNSQFYIKGFHLGPSFLPIVPHPDPWTHYTNCHIAKTV